MGVQGRDLFGYRGNVTVEAMREAAAETAQELGAERISSQRSMLEQMEEMTNPFAAKMATKEKPIKARMTKAEKVLAEQREKGLVPVQAIKDAASKFQKRSNGELQEQLLLLLRVEYLDEKDSAEDILRKMAEVFQGRDLAVQDEVLDFLLETTEGPLKEAVRTAQEEFRRSHGREILSGRNIAEAARGAAAEGLGTPTTLRDLYRDITGNPRDVNTLFDELSNKWTYAELRKVVKFLLSSLGADLRSKGPSIPRGLLHNLLTEARTLQAILGVYAFFRGRMPLMNKMFRRAGLTAPSTLTFETLAKLFMSLVNDRYPSEEKVLQLAVKLGLGQWLRAKIIVLSQLRDAIREVAKERIYRSLQDRDKLYDTIILALENLEDELQELEALEEEEFAFAPELVITADKQSAHPGETITFTAEVTQGIAPYTLYWQWGESNEWKVADSPYSCDMPATRSNYVPMIVIARDSRQASSKTFIMKIKVGEG